MVRTKDCEMPSTDTLQKCVAFAAVKKKCSVEIGGTVFFMVHPIEETNHVALYVVTNRHVAKKGQIPGQTLLLRVNDRNGGPALIETRDFEWEYHDNPRIDLAATCMPWSDDDVLYPTRR
jgi:hypothetical protein